MASGGFVFQAVISEAELENVRAILVQATAAKERAERTLRGLEVEYQTLRSATITAGSVEERRFYGLHWQRHALSLFVEQQTPVIEELYSLTNNVWTHQELLEEEQRATTSESDEEGFTVASAA
jgi:hypothetical protein